MTFQQLAASGPSQEAAQEAGAVGDQLRVLATTTEVELEGLSTGALATEATRQTDVTALNHSIDRLATTVGVPSPGQSPESPGAAGPAA